jgi:hypothetical protein
MDPASKAQPCGDGDTFGGELDMRRSGMRVTGGDPHLSESTPPLALTQDEAALFEATEGTGHHRPVARRP